MVHAVAAAESGWASSKLAFGVCKQFWLNYSDRKNDLGQIKGSWGFGKIPWMFRQICRWNILICPKFYAMLTNWKILRWRKMLTTVLRWSWQPHGRTWNAQLGMILILRRSGDSFEKCITILLTKLPKTIDLKGMFHLALRLYFFCHHLNMIRFCSGG